MKTLKQAMDDELKYVEISEFCKNQIISEATGNGTKKNKLPRVGAAVITIFCLLAGSTAVYAVSSHFFGGGFINKEEMPELDEYQVVAANNLTSDSDYRTSYGNMVFYDYKEVIDNLGIKLLNSTMTEGNNQMRIIYDNSSEAVIIKVNGFIIGDSTITGVSEDGESYTFEPGKVYGSPVTLKVSFATTQNQAEDGLDVWYLGYYKFDYNYVSDQGWKVNVITDSEEISEEQLEQYPLYQPVVISVFVVDGIRYELRGCISEDLMEEIVNSMSY